MSAVNKPTKEEIESDAREVMQSLKDRCWPGYEPVPGKKPYSPGSCRPMSIAERRMQMLDDEYTSGTEEPVKENIKNGTHLASEDDLDLKPTDGMKKEADKALAWKKEGKAGGTEVGMARANQLSKKENLSPDTVMRMHSYFSRHEVDKKGEGFSPGEKGFPSAGRVAWGLWGGDAGQSWAKTKSEQIQKAREND